jgi:hypothetical protein
MNNIQTQLPPSQSVIRTRIMKTKPIAAIAATLTALIAAIAALPTTSANIENCKHAPTSEYVCVSTDNEAPMTIIARVMINGKPASHQAVTMRLTPSAGIASYTCQTATVTAAVCRFGQSAAETYSIRVNVVGVEFAWNNGGWR